MHDDHIPFKFAGDKPAPRKQDPHIGKTVFCIVLAVLAVGALLRFFL